jgi:tetratricopeptide (TPR) repeat protein
MKKMMMMAMMLVASATAFAGDSDALKAVLKTKDFAEAEQLLKQNVNQMADAAEKAKAYNHLVDLAMKKVTKETGIILENQVGQQMGRAANEIVPYDTLGLANALCDAIYNAIECNKYDQQPNAKGKIAPKYAEKNAQRIWAVRNPHLVNIGQEEANKHNKDNALRFWGAFVDSGVDPLFAAQNHEAEKEYFGQVALFSGRYAYEKKDFERGDRYIAIARQDPTQEKDALATQLWYTRTGLTNHADSVAATNRLKALYEAEPQNDALLDALYSMYDGARDKAAQVALLDNHLAKYPNSFAALANKGLMAMADNDAVKAVEWLNKAAAAKPDNAVIYTYLGICLSSQAATTEDAAKSKDFYKQAIDAFDKAKELDPEKKMANWGYNRYQAYYGLYGEEDPRTKAAEADR